MMPRSAQDDKFCTRSRSRRRGRVTHTSELTVFTSAPRENPVIFCSPEVTCLHQHLNRHLGGRCQRPPALPCGLPAAGYLAPLDSTAPMMPRSAQDDKFCTALALTATRQSDTHV